MVYSRGNLQHNYLGDICIHIGYINLALDTVVQSSKKHNYRA